MTQQKVSYPLVTEDELDQALAYVREHKEYKAVTLDRNMLRTLFNKMTKQRKRGSKLALLAATVVRDHIPPRFKGAVRVIEAYTGAIMKIMSIRRVHQLQRAQTVETKPAPTPQDETYPMREDGQYVML
jgi:hypothetical protein